MWGYSTSRFSLSLHRFGHKVQLNHLIKESIKIYDNKRPHLSLQYKTTNFVHEKKREKLISRFNIFNFNLSTYFRTSHSVISSITTFTFESIDPSVILPFILLSRAITSDKSMII